MIILGIDPGLATTGFGVISFKPSETAQKENKQFELISYGCLVTDKTIDEARRLGSLYKDTKKVIQEYKPDIITIERLFFFKNAKTIISVGQARGVVMLAAGQSRIDILEYAPLEIKATIVGYGRAKKKEVEERVKEILRKRKLKLDKNKKTKDGYHLDDAVDALAVAICHVYKTE